MSWYRWLGCAVLLGVVDAAWWYALLGVLGFVAGIGHSPLSWFVVTAVLSLSIVAHAVQALMPTARARRRTGLWVLAALTLWLSVGASTGFGGSGSAEHTTGYSWPLELLLLRAESAAWSGLVLVILIVVLLWRHGAHRARAVVGTPAFARSFRTGLVVFTLTLAFESAGDLDLGTGIAIAPFFISALFGMAAARAPAHGVRLPVWFALSFTVIAVVVLVGLTASVLLVSALRGGFGAVRDGWLTLARSIDRSVSETLAELLGTRDAGGIDLQSAAAEPSQALVLFVLLLGAVVFALLFHKLLNAPPRVELPAIALDLGSAERESIADAENVPAAHWVDALASRWPWRRRQGFAPNPLPQDPALARVHALYYAVLERARRKGVAIDPAQTPRERIDALTRAFPDLPIAALTRAFETACYARRALLNTQWQQLAAQFVRERD